MKANKRYTHIPAQPGWEAFICTWPRWDNGEASDYVIERSPVVVWEVESEGGESGRGESYFFSTAKPVWVGGQDLGERPALMAPDGSVHIGSLRFNSVDDYAVWDWIDIAVREGMNDEARRMIELNKGSIPALAELEGRMLEAAE
jgi:hypothetical protein